MDERIFIEYEHQKRKQRRALLCRNMFIYYLHFLIDQSINIYPRTIWSYSKSGYWWSNIVPMMNDKQFKNNFRIQRSTFKEILDQVGPYLKKKDTVLRPAIPVDKRLACALYLLGSTCELRTVAHLFGIGKSTAAQLLHDFCEVLVNLFFHRLIKFPVNDQQVKQTTDAFLNKYGYPMCIGSIDGTHISIEPPIGEETDYFNYKKFHSIILLGVVDASLKFSYVNIGAPDPAYVVGPQHSSRTISQPHSTVVSTDHYRRLTEELNKCFDDIELFIRYIEAIMEYTKELERDYRRKDKKSSGLKQMVEKLPDDRYFIDILQKFKHSFNLLGELKYIIHSPNAPELIHYLLSPLQLILHTLRTKHPNQLQLAYDIWTPALTKEARELLINCLTSKEQEVLWNLGPAWIRTAEEVPQKIVEYRPLFFEGRPIWFQEPSNDYSLQSARSIDERQPSVWSSPRQPNQNNNNNGSSINHHTQFARQPSPAAQFDTSTVDRSNKTSVVENYNEHAWAIDRKRAGAKIYVVKFDRQGQNNKELTVRCGELIEIENNSKKWWRARNFHGDVGHVPHNIVDEIELEQLLVKNTSSNTSVVLPRPSSAPNRGFTHVNGHHQHNTNGYTQHLLRSPSNGNNFIMQSNSTTYTNPTIIRDHLLQQTFSPLVSSPPLAPSPPPLSIPPPPPMPSQLLTNRSSTWSTLQLPESNRKGRRSRSNTNLSTQRVDVLQQELTQRITDRIGFISPNSSKEDVQRWLASKHISTKLAQNLHGMNGEELFQLTKSTLDQFTNEHESARIYELLLQQKQLAGYRTGDIPERSPHLNNSALSSFKANTINDADDNFSLRPDDTLSRSLKIKLKQRRDRIEQAESADPIEL
ncbi:unnamed protein product [Rotaria sordida]|uniref:SH3 domain-containing protein n=1 Tax=Rotaria sordida TaxID=392033 RepID=A0A813W7H4_9BILA|nr:unnamed protein product [Rotaria sordida]